MKVLIDERWLYGDVEYKKGDTIEMAKERFISLVEQGVKLKEVKELKEFKDVETKKKKDDL